MKEDFLWTEKYRPQTLADTILPKATRATLEGFVKQGDLPNLLFTGRPGIGKTTVAKALVKEIESDYYVINGSLDGNIATLRTDIQEYASTVSILGGRKYVIIDESDYLNQNSTQPALRSFIETASKNCGFILTANYPQRLIEALRESRLTTVSFTIPKEEKKTLVLAFFNRVKDILNKEGVEYDENTLGPLIIKHFPDMRRTLNELQRYAALSGKIDSGILATSFGVNYKDLFGFMKEKSFTNVRKWVGEHSDVEDYEVFRSLYDLSKDYVEPESIPFLVVKLAEYQAHSAVVVDKEINMAACLVDLMAECSFK